LLSFREWIRGFAVSSREKLLAVFQGVDQRLRGQLRGETPCSLSGSGSEASLSAQEEPPNSVRDIREELSLSVGSFRSRSICLDSLARRLALFNRIRLKRL
jgi:hypothetical protein